MNPHQSETETIHSTPFTKSEPYYVIAADMAFLRPGDPTSACYDCVVTRANHRWEAMENALASSEDGYTPIAAFNETDLREMLDELSASALKDGQAFNLTKDWAVPGDE